MVTLLVLADDFTGALDTGIKFADSGVYTKVITGKTVDFAQISPEVVVLVIDLQTRHVEQGLAYQTVYHMVKQAKAFGIPYIFKKTDSGLRGNIGSELSALYDATNNTPVSFIPALPDLNRITSHGVQIIDGVFVSKSVFGRDPFSPVTKDSVAEIIKQQAAKPVAVQLKGDTHHHFTAITVYDATTNEDIWEIGQRLKENNALNAIAGCSGFGAILPELLELQGNHKNESIASNRLIVVCGSVNPITTAQVAYATMSGFVHVALTLEEKMLPRYWQSDKGRARLHEIKAQLDKKRRIIFSSFDETADETLTYGKQQGMNATEVGGQIASSMGELLKALIEIGLDGTYLVTGGDTLLGFMDEINQHELAMVTEILPGNVLSHLTYQGKLVQVISKSGGFGAEDNFIQLAQKLLGGEEDET